jgi:hypothetical protein
VGAIVLSLAVHALAGLAMYLTPSPPPRAPAAAALTWVDVAPAVEDVTPPPAVTPEPVRPVTETAATRKKKKTRNGDVLQNAIPMTTTLYPAKSRHRLIRYNPMKILSLPLVSVVVLPVYCGLNPTTTLTPPPRPRPNAPGNPRISL